MVDAGDIYRHAEYGVVEVRAVRTTLDTVISDGALTKTRVVDFDTAHDPDGSGAEQGPAAAGTEPLDAFLADATPLE